MYLLHAMKVCDKTWWQWGILIVLVALSERFKLVVIDRQTQQNQSNRFYEQRESFFSVFHFEKPNELFLYYNVRMASNISKLVQLNNSWWAGLFQSTWWRNILLQNMFSSASQLASYLLCTYDLWYKENQGQSFLNKLLHTNLLLILLIPDLGNSRLSQIACDDKGPSFNWIHSLWINTFGFEWASAAQSSCDIPCISLVSKYFQVNHKSTMVKVSEKVTCMYKEFVLNDSYHHDKPVQNNIR